MADAPRDDLDDGTRANRALLLGGITFTLHQGNSTVQEWDLSQVDEGRVRARTPSRWWTIQVIPEDVISDDDG